LYDTILPIIADHCLISEFIQVAEMAWRSGSIWAGYLAPWDKIAYALEVGQRYLMENTTLGIPAMFQSEGTNWCDTDTVAY
jgi:hypothetical protein